MKKYAIFILAFLFVFGSITWTGAGPKGKGLGKVQGIKVYDANGQYLGVLLDMVPHMYGVDVDVRVYMPELGKYVVIDFEGKVESCTWHYKEPLCSGTPYVFPKYNYHVFKHPTEERYFTADWLPEEISVQSRRGTVQGCEYHLEVFKMIPVAEEVYLPFEEPVALPLVFK